MMRPMVFEVSPAAPTALTAVASSGPTKISLAWANHWTVPVATNVLVQRATNIAFSQNTTAFSAPANAVTYVDTAVAPNTHYYYRVRAENANSYSQWTLIAGATTPGAVPFAPANLTIGNATRTSLQATWTNPAGGGPVTNNVVQYSTAGSGGPWTTAATLGPNSTTYTITGLRNNTTYWIRVNAVGPNGTASSAVKTGTTLR
jgi:phosphodiesterase/alkaline phosphatase D-like protein